MTTRRAERIKTQLLEHCRNTWGGQDIYFSINPDSAKNGRAVLADMQAFLCSLGLSATTTRQLTQILPTMFQGSKIYFPSRPSDSEVLASFTGNNHLEVCRRWKISGRTLYRILHRSTSK